MVSEFVFSFVCVCVFLCVCVFCLFWFFVPYIEIWNDKLRTFGVCLFWWFFNFFLRVFVAGLSAFHEKRSHNNPLCIYIYIYMYVWVGWICLDSILEVPIMAAHGFGCHMTS